MTLFLQFFLLIFILIGIFKNKEGAFLKQGAVTLMVLSNIGALYLAFINGNKEGASHIGWIDVRDILEYFWICISGMLAGLLLYLFSTARR